MKKLSALIIILLLAQNVYCWGFWAHQRINYYAVFLLPPEMMVLYKPNINFIAEHAVDPDKRRYAVPEEGPRHYIDLDSYGSYPYNELPRFYDSAVAKFGEDTVNSRGIVPWHVQVMLGRLTKAFKEKNFTAIMKNSADIGHYIADAHVPLHASSNHDGQHSGQKGIHGFWESRIPELIAEQEWDFMIGKAAYVSSPSKHIWKVVTESGKLSSEVLATDLQLSKAMRDDSKYAFEERNGIITRQFSSAYTRAYHKNMNGMVERRMREAILCVASFWYTAWVNAGQPDLSELANHQFSEEDQKQFELLNEQWRNGKSMIGRQE